VTVTSAGLPPSAARASSNVAAAPDSVETPATTAFDVAASSHLLRDAIPVVSFAAAPPDTGDDDFFIPPETKKKLAREITVFLIVSVFVAYFIIKVFIEKDKEEPPPPPGGKPIPTPSQ